MVGELGLLTRTKRMMTVRANQRSRVWVCTRQTFKSEIKHSVEETELTKTSFGKRACHRRFPDRDEKIDRIRHGIRPVRSVHERHVRKRRV